MIIYNPYCLLMTVKNDDIRAQKSKAGKFKMNEILVKKK